MESMVDGRKNGKGHREIILGICTYSNSDCADELNSSGRRERITVSSL